MSDTPLNIRPSLRQYGKYAKTTPLLLLPLIVGGIIRADSLGATAIGGLIGIGVVLAALYMHRVHIVLTPSELIRVGIVRRRRWQRSAVATAIGVFMPASGMDPRAFYNLFLLDPRGRKILRLRDTHWNKADISRLAEALALPVADHDQPMTGEQFDRRYPNILSFFERRQRVILLASLPMGVALGLVIALAILLTA